MAETLHCEQCGGDSPADARFCIDCGAPLAVRPLGPATGATTRLPGVRCPSCATSNPEHARFCVVCGRGLAAGAAPPARPPQPAPQPPPMGGAPRRPYAPRQQSYPRVATPHAPIPVAPARPAPVHQRRPSAWQGGGPLLFLIGLFVLLMTGAIWPGILWLIGISSFVGAAAMGRGDKALLALFWWGGLALLFATGTFWPGILLLLFLGMALGRGGRGFGCW